MKKTNVLTRLRKFFRKSELGQSTVEYILILAAVVMVASKFGPQLKGIVDNVLGKTQKQIEADLQ